MRTPPMRVPALPASSAPFGLHFNSSATEQPARWLNSSARPPTQASGFSMTCFTLIFGAVSNLVALGILARLKGSRRQSKAPFWLLTVALLLSDLGGHVVLGAFALYMHAGLRFEKHVWEPGKLLCGVFGASMVFFGLYPLLLGGAMAAERCVAITKPFFHHSNVSPGRVRLVVALLLCVALVLAALPLCAVGTYTTQYPGTWCFLPIHGSRSAADSILALAFSCLGLAALALSLLCNILSGSALLYTRRRAREDANRGAGFPSRRKSSAVSTSSLLCSLDVEMMAQLAAITVIFCVCWSPFLIHILCSQFHQSLIPATRDKDDFALLCVRLASWNQILDPWVYILLRKGVFLFFNTQRTAEAVNTE